MFASVLVGVLAISATLGPTTAAASSDPDHDGLTTAFELTRSHTDPHRTDTDGDGTPDGLEDPDGDHLPNIWEMRLGLDPLRKDTDRDGIRDDREDPDHDGLHNGFEIRRSKTDPRTADSDADGIRDGAEDPDQDGLSDLGEQKYRTDPFDPDTDHDGQTDWNEDSNGDHMADGLTQDARPVPRDLAPSLSRPRDRPPAFWACQQKLGVAAVLICQRGHAGKRVVLFGDSHALQWRGPLERVAAARGWRLWFITKSACPIARIALAAPDCAAWREVPSGPSRHSTPTWSSPRISTPTGPWTPRMTRTQRASGAPASRRPSGPSVDMPVRSSCWVIRPAGTTRQPASRHTLGTSRRAACSAR